MMEWTLQQLELYQGDEVDRALTSLEVYQGDGVDRAFHHLRAIPR